MAPAEIRRLIDSRELHGSGAGGVVVRPAAADVSHHVDDLLRSLGADDGRHDRSQVLDRGPHLGPDVEAGARVPGPPDVLRRRGETYRAESVSTPGTAPSKIASKCLSRPVGSLA